MLDPSSAPFLFALFPFTEKAIGYAGGKVADALAKPLTEAIEEKARWLSGTDDTGIRWAAFAEAYDETTPRFAESAPNRAAALSVRQAFQGWDVKTGKGFEKLRRNSANRPCLRPCKIRTG